MRHLGLALLLVIGVVVPAGRAGAQPAAHLFWEGCTGTAAALPAKSFAGPATYRQVVSGTGFTGTVRGYEIVLRARSPGGIPDAWRLDAGGCQAGRVTIMTASSSKACPSLGALASVTSTITYDAASGSIDLRLTSSFSPFTATSSVTYSLFRIDYDFTAATAAKTVPGDSCGGAGAPVCFALVDARWIDDAFTEQPMASGNGAVTWNDAGGVATVCSDLNLDGVRLDEALFACASGDTAAQFVELVAERAATFSPLLRLLVRNRAGEIVLDRADLFGARSGEPWPAGTRWLVATPALGDEKGVSADLTLKLSLDSEGGSVDLIDDRPGAPMVHALRYGGAGEPPAPPAGQSLQRAADGTFSASTTVTPTNAAGAMAEAFACRSSAAGVRIQEFAIDCVGCVRRNRPFVELVAAEPGQRFASGLRLHVLDARGYLLYDIGDLFDAAHRDEPWPEGTTWLLGSAASVPLPDRSILATLSATGGTIRLVDIPAGRVVVSEVRYGPGGFPAPDFGRSLERRDDATYEENPTPSPTRHDGTFSAPPQCYGPPPGPLMAATRFSEIGLACTGGDPRSQFIELTSSSNQTFHSRVRLKVRNAAGSVVLDRGSLFAPRFDGEAWPAGRSWLFATQVFADLTGLVPDLVLPTVLPAESALLTLYDPGECGSPLTIDEVSYGPPGPVPAPAPGRSLVRTADGTLVETALLSPTRFDGTSVSENPCVCPVTTRISEIGLACSGGDARSQFLELAGTVDQALPASLRVRARDENGTTVLDQGGLFASRPAGTLWPAGKTWLLGTRAFADLTGLAPDFILPAVLPANGATLTLFDPGVCGGVTIDEVRYGVAGAPPAPAPGNSLDRTSEGALREISPIHPTRFDGGTVSQNSCPCPVANLICEGLIEATLEPRDSVFCKTPSGYVNEAGFDLVQGFLFGKGREGAAHVGDEYVVSGPPPGTELRFAVRIEARATASGGLDGTGAIGLCLATDGSNEVSLTATAHGTGNFDVEEQVLRLELQKTAGVPFRLHYSASGRSSYGTGSGLLRFSFVDLPPGSRITSCHGYQQDIATSARLSLVAHEVAPGQVRLVWHSSDRTHSEGTLERRTEGEEWSTVAALRSGPGGLFEYEDRGLDAGGRFAYRLGVANDGAHEWTDPLWVDVPSALRFAIQGIAPNPSAGDAFLTFSLARAEVVRIEVLDVQGRLVLALDPAISQPGRHAVRLAGSGRLAAGVYLVRLIQGGEAATAKLARVR